MTTEAFDRVSAIIGTVMNDAWVRIITDLAEVAKGAKSPSHLLVSGPSALSLSDIKDFFAVAGGANLEINFPCVVPKDRVGLFQAACVDHGIPSALSAKNPAVTGISGSISIGVGISF